MSHEIYDLAHSPCRHNSFIFVKMFSSIDVASLWGVFGRREFIVRAYIAAQIFYFLFWLTVSCLSSSAWKLVVWLICIFVHPSSAIHFSFLWTAHKKFLSDWTDETANSLTGSLLGWKTAISQDKVLINAIHGGAKDTQWLVWVEVLWVKSLDTQVLFFKSKVKSTHHLHSLHHKLYNSITSILSVLVCSSWLWCPFPLIFLVLVGF